MIPLNDWYKELPEYEISLEKNSKHIIWNVRASRLSESGWDKGTVLVLHDVTERRKMERSLVEANHMLSVMNGINRHDLRNDVVALSGYLQLLNDNAPNPVSKARLNQAMKVLARMTQHIESSQEVQDIGKKDPIWQDVEIVARKAFSSIEMGDISVHYDLNGISVLSDPLLERMFYNLAENSIRHGKQVSYIRLSCQLDGDERLIILEDDGVGVPLEDKERIFKRGFGSNTGMGLYLAREIAENTGITITEKGSKGARFEIRVPSGHWVERSI
jgi:signal transduction histidine kinase